MSGQIEQILKYALDAGASDIILAENKKPCIRLNGNVGALAEAPEISKEDLDSFFSSFSLSSEKTIIGPLLGSRFRVFFTRSASGKVFILRPLLPAIPDFGSINAPESVQNLLSLVSGLLLFAGKPSSGKTIASMSFIEAYCKQNLKRLAIFDESEEYEFSLNETLLIRASLKENPEEIVSPILASGIDVFYFGNLKKEHFALALKAASSGALVVGTVQANSSVAVLSQFLNENVSRILLASTLSSIVVEHLLPSSDNTALVPAWEVLYNNPNIAAQIRNGDLYKIPQLIHMGKQEGMLSLDDSLMQLVQASYITKEEACRIASEPAKFV